MIGQAGRYSGSFTMGVEPIQPVRADKALRCFPRDRLGTSTCVSAFHAAARERKIARC
jgi:hypothetical protein